MGDAQGNIRCCTTATRVLAGVATGAGLVWMGRWVFERCLPTLAFHVIRHLPGPRGLPGPPCYGRHPAPAGLAFLVPICKVFACSFLDLEPASASPSASGSRLCLCLRLLSNRLNTPSIIPINTSSSIDKPIRSTCSPRDFSMGRSPWKGMSRTSEDRTAPQRATCTSSQC